MTLTAYSSHRQMVGARPRSAMITLRHDAYQPFAVCEDNRENQFARAGLPVIERLAEDLAELPISIVLIDSGAKLIGRVVGAPASASALSAIGSLTVAAPITDSASNAGRWAVGITCRDHPSAAAPLASLMPNSQHAPSPTAWSILPRLRPAHCWSTFCGLVGGTRARHLPVMAANCSRTPPPRSSSNRTIHADSGTGQDASKRAHLRLASSTSAPDRHRPLRTVVIGSDAIGALIHVPKPRPLRPRFTQARSYAPSADVRVGRPPVVGARHRQARGRRTHQSRGRGTHLRLAAHRRLPPSPDLPQAFDHITDRTGPPGDRARLHLSRTRCLGIITTGCDDFNGGRDYAGSG